MPAFHEIDEFACDAIFSQKKCLGLVAYNNKMVQFSSKGIKNTLRNENLKVTQWKNYFS
jgi:hypothetical protein